MQENPLDKLHDIKPLVQIPDNSFFIFLALVIFTFVIFLGVIFFFLKLYKNRKKSDKKRYFEILENINFKDSKQSAYTITKYSRLLARTQREKKICEELIQNLENYKYKKNVQEIDEKIKANFLNFMEIIDV